jgi:hypothetical protein
LKFRLPPPKTSLKAGGEKVKKRKKGSNMTDSEDSDESDFRRAWKKYKAKKKAHHEAEAAEAAEQAPKKRGRPPKPKDDSDTKITSSHSFDASVFVSIEQPPEMVRGKTHRTDKLVPKKPRIEGPFTLTKSMRWTQFLDEVAECMDIDKENMHLDRMTWAFQKQKEPLPLSTEQGFKTMQEQVSAKGQAATVVFVYHPISKKAGRQLKAHGSQGKDDDQENKVGDMNRGLGEDDSRWGKKVRKAITASKRQAESHTLSSSIWTRSSLLSSHSLKISILLATVQIIQTFVVFTGLSEAKPGILNLIKAGCQSGQMQLYVVTGNISLLFA